MSRCWGNEAFQEVNISAVILHLEKLRQKGVCKVMQYPLVELWIQPSTVSSCSCSCLASLRKILLKNILSFMNASKTKTREAKTNSSVLSLTGFSFAFCFPRLFFFSSDKGKYSKNEENVKEKIQKLPAWEGEFQCRNWTIHAWALQIGNMCHLFIETIHPSCDWEQNSNAKLSSVRAEYSWRS